MNVLFHPDAELDFNAGIDYYEAIEKRFGLRFFARDCIRHR